MGLEFLLLDNWSLVIAHWLRLVASFASPSFALRASFVVMQWSIAFRASFAVLSFGFAVMHCHS